jgi:antirestriction protein ArdC
MSYSPPPPEIWAAERIIEMIEKGSLPPWRKTWTMNEANYPRNMTRMNKPYKGMNFWLLMCAPYDLPYYMTYKQIAELGGNVIKGEKSWPVHFWSMKKYTDKNGNEKENWFCKGYRVFNVAQCENIPPEKIPPLPKPAEEFEHEPLEICEAIVKGYPNPPTIKHEGQQPCYIPSKDTVRMTAMRRFPQREEYYSTIFHELGHSTGHKTRLDRDAINKIGGFGDHAYSEEELVAEFTASMLCAKAGIANNVIENSAAYVGSWLKRLKSDPKMLVIAVKSAEKAFRHIMNETRAEQVADSVPPSESEDAAQ